MSEVAGGPGRCAGLAVVAWTLVVCGQWVTCCVRSRARGVVCSRGGPWSPGLWSYVVSG